MPNWPRFGRRAWAIVTAIVDVVRTVQKKPPAAGAPKVVPTADEAFEKWRDVKAPPNG